MASDWNAVLSELDRRLGFASLGSVRRTRRSSSGGDIAFEVSLAQVSDSWEATFARGLIAGVEPVIGRLRISELDPNTGLPPILRIDPVKDIDPATGTGYVYACLSLTADWAIQRIEPVCLSAPPPAADRKRRAFKLLAFLTRTPPGDTSATLTVWQAVEHNLGWAAIQRRSSGAARHLFWATS